jgi:hypothetical protein
MARALRIQYPGAHYHVSCRGNEKRAMFEDAQDQKVFLEKPSLSPNIYNVDISSERLTLLVLISA